MAMEHGVLVSVGEQLGVVFVRLEKGLNHCTEKQRSRNRLVVHSRRKGPILYNGIRKRLF